MHPDTQHLFSREPLDRQPWSLLAGDRIKHTNPVT